MKALAYDVMAGRGVASSIDVIITHATPLSEAARGYEIFGKKEEDCRKVVFTAG